MVEVLPGVHLVNCTGGINAYVIVEKGGITVVDTGIRGGDKAVLKTVKGLGYGPSDIKRIVITHAHMDHTGGLKALRDATGAKVMAGEADSDVIEGKKPAIMPEMRRPLGLIRPVLLGLFKSTPTTVDRRLKDGDTIPVLGGLKVVGLPGHSPGSIGLYCPAKKLIFSGDALRMKGGEFIKPLNYDAEKARCVASIKKMGTLDFEVMLSGHDRPITAGASKRVVAYAEKLGREP